MDFLPYAFRKHPPPQELQIGKFMALLGESLDTPLGTMTGIDLQLPRSVPNIILLPGEKSEYYASQDFTLKNHQLLTLEGNFNSYFKVYSVPGYQIFALEVLSPEFMQSLLDINNSFVIMFALDHAYVLLQEPRKLDAITNKELEEAANQLSKSIDRKMRSWSETDADNSSKRMLEWENTPSVRLKGKQLDYRIYAGLVAASVLIFILLWTDLVTNRNQAGSPHLKEDALWTLGVLVLLPLYSYFSRR